MIALLVCTIVLTMLAETVLSARHESALRARGAVEPAGDVINVMALAYPASFAAMFAEGVARGAGPGPLLAVGVVVFASAKALKYWAIASLGERWTFRVLVPPGAVSTAAGPYRWVSHPNYLAVAGEIVGCALAMQAIVTGPLAFAGFGLLMLRRIKVEEAALTGR